MNVQSELKSMHRYLMYKKFPYHSVSVVHRHQDMGFHVIFMKSVKEMVTDEIKDYIKVMEFTFSYVA
jgi:hypothetical protein